MNETDIVLLLLFTVLWFGMCAAIEWQVERDLRVARRREKRLREKGIDGVLSAIADNTTRATMYDRWTVVALALAALLTLVVRYIDFATPYPVDVVFRYAVTIVSVAALVPFYLRCRERRWIAEHVENEGENGL